MNIIKLSLPLLFVLSVAGCQTEMIKETQQNVDSAVNKAVTNKDKVGVRQNAKETDTVADKSGAWLPIKEITVPEKLDPRLTRNFTINRKLRSLNEAAERIVSLSGIPAYVSPDVNNSSGSSSSSAPAPAPAPALTGGTSEVGLPPALPTGTTGGVNREFDASYHGPLAGFLDVLSAHYNVSWEFRDGVIDFFKYKTRVFVVQTIPGTVTSNSEVSPSSGEPTLSTKISLDELDIWDDIEKSIESMLTEDGEVVVSPSIGTVVVTDTPRVIDVVGHYIEQENSHLTKQVVIDAKVIAVTLKDEDSYGINWKVVNESLKSALGATFTSGDPLTVGASALTLKKFATGDTLQSGQTVTSDSRWQGSEVFIEALSTQGDVSIVNSASAITLNNQPVPIHVGKTTSYLAESSTTPPVTAGLAPTTSLQAGSVTTGFTMNLLPHIQNDEDLILQYGIDLSSLTGLFTISAGGTSIQVPEVETRRMLQRVKIKSGETIVLAGYENAENSTNNKGIGKATNTWAGGSTKGQQEKTIIVILVTPTIIGDE